MNLVVDYIISLTNLYGIVHKEKVIKIFNEQNKDAIKLTTIETVIKKEANTLSHFYTEVYEDYFVHESILYFNEFDEMLAGKSTIPFYVPIKEELLKYKDELYFEKTVEFQMLVNYVTNYFQTKSAEEVNEISEDIILTIKDNPDPSNVLNTFEIWEINFSDENSVAKAIELITLLVNNTRTWFTNGFTPEELREKNS